MKSGSLAQQGPVFVRPIKTKDVAEYMRISQLSVLRMVHAGAIPAKKVGNAYYYDPRKIAEICGIEPSE